MFVQNAMNSWVVECKRQASLVAAFAAAPHNVPAAAWTDASMRIVEAIDRKVGLCSSDGGVKWGWRVARSGHDR
jgi:hypothetical protein